MTLLRNAMMMAKSKPFNFSVKTNNAGTSNSTSFTMPTVNGGTYNCYVSYNGAAPVHITTYNDAAWTHDFGSTGTYPISISGIFNGIEFNNGGDRLKLLNISQWGILQLGNTGLNFKGAANLTITATDALNLVGVTNLGAMFSNCTSITTIPSINSWNFSAVTNFAGMFQNCSSFNQALTWTTTAATNMNTMFAGSAFNSVLTFSDVSHVTDFSFMFKASSFNQALTWTVTAATAMAGMFQSCGILNSAISFTGTGSVTDFSQMFSNCTSYNQTLTWTTTAATSSQVEPDFFLFVVCDDDFSFFKGFLR